MAGSTPTKRPYRETLEALVIAAIFLRFANTFVVQTFYIPSGSMEETLLVGDHLFVNRLIYGPRASGLEEALLPHRDIERGDVVIFRSPEDPRTDLVKRCVGLPGDRVELIDKRLYVNGGLVEDEVFTRHSDPRVYPDVASLGEQARRRDQFGPETVPEGHYFCLGDNRDESYDSRFLGPIPHELIKGRAFMIYWSNEGQTPDGRRESWAERLGRIGKTLVMFPVNTRWERSFQIIR